MGRLLLAVCTPLFGFGCSSGGASDVDNLAPLAVATATPEGGRAPVEIELSGDGSTDIDGTIATYEWILDEDAIGSGMTITHLFTEPGTYEVTLIVADDQGATDSTILTVIITGDEDDEPPTAVASTVGP